MSRQSDSDIIQSILGSIGPDALPPAQSGRCQLPTRGIHFHLRPSHIIFDPMTGPRARSGYFCGDGFATVAHSRHPHMSVVAALRSARRQCRNPHHLPPTPVAEARSETRDFPLTHVRYFATVGDEDSIIRLRKYMIHRCCRFTPIVSAFRFMTSRIRQQKASFGRGCGKCLMSWQHDSC